jgi:hypothetical protein
LAEEHRQQAYQYDYKILLQHEPIRSSITLWKQNTGTIYNKATTTQEYVDCTLLELGKLKPGQCMHKGCTHIKTTTTVN